jgi:hypothetical protein
LVDHRIAESHRRDYCYERNLIGRQTLGRK